MVALLEDGGAPFTSAGGTVHSFQQSLPRGEKGKGDKLARIAYVFTGAASSSDGGKLLCFAVSSEAFALSLSNHRCTPPLADSPSLPSPSGGLSLASTVTPQSHTRACKHAHWAISPGSLTRGSLLLREEFS